MQTARLRVVPTVRSAIGCTRRFCCPHVSPVRGFPRVVTHGEGPMKYVLAKVYVHGEMDFAKLVIRANSEAEHHLHVYDSLRDEASKVDLCTQCLGGGILEHEPDNSYMKIHGRSALLGKADHRETRDILCEQYPDYRIDAERGGMDI